MIMNDTFVPMFFWSRKIILELFCCFKVKFTLLWYFNVKLRLTDVAKYSISTELPKFLQIARIVNNRILSDLFWVKEYDSEAVEWFLVIYTP